MNKLLLQALMTIGGTLRGTVGGALGYLNTLLKSGFTTATQFHQEGIAFSREMGMSAKEAQAYTEVLTKRTEKLAATYGVAAEQIKQIQRGIAVATSRQLMLNEAQTEHFLQLNKLVGADTVNKFTEEIMGGMGGQLETVEGAVSKAYATAAKSGLNAQKVSEKIASNLNMANKLSFRTGIDGLTRMAMQAEKVGMSLQSVEAVANNFLEIDDAISHAAQLQMLGGAAGAFGGNPMDMLYEANYDPEALQKRMTSMLGGYARFDANTGIANINGANMDMVRNIAKAMGISTEEASRVAKKNAELRYKESHINTSAYRGMGLTQEQIDFLINKSNVKDGKVMFTDSNGKETELSANGKINEEVLKEMMKYEGMSDHDIMAENAKSLTSINEKLTGIATSISAMFASFLNGFFPDFVKYGDNIGQFLKDKLQPIAKNIGVAARGIFDWFKNNKDLIKTVASGVLGFIKAFTYILGPVIKAANEWPKTSAAIIAAIWAAKKINGITSRGANGARSAASGSFSGKEITSRARGDYRAGRQLGMSRRQAFAEANRDAARAAGGYGKLGRAGLKMAKGGGIAALAGLAGGMITDYAVEKGDIEKGSTTHKLASAGTRALEYGGTGAMIGGMIGSFVPVIGNAVGAAVGGAIGGVWGGLSGYFDAKEAAKEGARAKAEPHAEGGIVGGTSYNGDKVLTRLNSGEMVLNMNQQSKLFNAIKNLTTPIIPTTSILTNNTANSRHTIQTKEVTIQTIGLSGLSTKVKGVAPVPTKIEAKPVGEKEYIYTPKNTNTTTVNGGTVTVKDFNININGTLRLDGGSSSKNLNMNDLLNNQQFVSAIKQMVQERINSDFNGGRLSTSPSVMSGLSTQVNSYGKKA